MQKKKTSANSLQFNLGSKKWGMVLCTTVKILLLPKYFDMQRFGIQTSVNERLYFSINSGGARYMEVLGTDWKTIIIL